MNARINAMTNAVMKAAALAARADRRLLPALALIAALTSVLIFKAGYGYHREAVARIASMDEQYCAFESMTGRAGEFTGLKKAYEDRIRALESGLLDADRPSIGAAKLQETFRALASKNGVAVTSQRAMPAVYAGRYVRVPVEFKVTAGLAQLKELLCDIRDSQALIGLRYLRIRAPEAGGQAGLEVTIVIEGAIMKQAGA